MKASQFASALAASLTHLDTPKESAAPVEPMSAREECESAIRAVIEVHDKLPSLAERRLELVMYALRKSLEEFNHMEFSFPMARNRLEKVIEEIEKMV